MPLRSLNHVLSGFESRFATKEQKQFQRLQRGWIEIVGSVVAAQTKPIALQRGVLRVATSSAAWAQNLVFERQRILEKLNAQLGLSLIDIRFSNAQWQPSQTSTPGEVMQAELWQGHPSRIGIAAHALLAAPPSDDPIDVFQRWANQMKSHRQHLPNCPNCHCPTPPGELDRWQVCSICAAKQWQHSTPQSQVSESQAP